VYPSAYSGRRASNTPTPNAMPARVTRATMARIGRPKKTDGRHIGELYEFTGPRLLTFAEAVDAVGQAAGRDIRHVPVSD
jgi:uncharacterized protein YbjT (DUF2867 family)